MYINQILILINKTPETGENPRSQDLQLLTDTQSGSVSGCKPDFVYSVDFDFIVLFL